MTRPVEEHFCSKPGTHSKHRYSRAVLIPTTRRTAHRPGKLWQSHKFSMASQSCTANFRKLPCCPSPSTCGSEHQPAKEEAGVWGTALRNRVRECRGGGPSGRKAESTQLCTHCQSTLGKRPQVTRAGKGQRLQGQQAGSRNGLSSQMFPFPMSSLPPSKTAPKQETAAAYKECEGPCQGLWRGKPGLIRPWRQNQIFINECESMETPGER